MPNYRISSPLSIEIGIEITVDSAEGFRKALERAVPLSLEAGAESFYRTGNAVMTTSKTQYVPVRTGALRATGMVTKPEVKERTVTVTLSYGDEVVDYAIPVHEIDKHYNVGQWKYLEIPLMQAVPDIREDLISTINRKLERR